MKYLVAICLVLLLLAVLLPSIQAHKSESTLYVENRISFDGLKAAGFNLGAFSPMPLTKGNMTAYFIDIGQGDSILIQFASKNILIDGGDKEMGERVVGLLQDKGVKKIDLLVATHPHDDHIGGLISVFKAFQIDEVLDSGQAHTSNTYRSFLGLIEQKNINYIAADSGKKIDLAPGLGIEVLSPPQGDIGDDLNDDSVVLRFIYGDISFLITGDAGQAAEKRMILYGYGLDSDVLKVGHHGSKTSTGKAFLGIVTPKVSVISVGAGNSYGHPSSEILKRLEQAGTEIYRTDLNGSVVATTNGRSIYVYAEKGNVRSGLVGHSRDTSSDPVRKASDIPAQSISTSSNSSSVRIISIQFDAPGNERQNLNGEWVEIGNFGSSPVQLQGWKLSDEGDKNIYTFPIFNIRPGYRVKVFTGTGSSNESGLYMGKKVPIWDNSGDTATLTNVDGCVIDQARA
jgi:competence protein ComEC